MRLRTFIPLTWVVVSACQVIAGVGERQFGDPDSDGGGGRGGSADGDVDGRDLSASDAEGGNSESGPPLDGSSDAIGSPDAGEPDAEGRDAQHRDTAAPDAQNRADASGECDLTGRAEHVELYDGVDPTKTFVNTHHAYVGRGGDRCSGVLIARDLFLSAGHCNYLVGDVIDMTFQIDRTTGLVRPASSFGVVEVIDSEYTTSGDINDLDYAVLRLSGNPGNVYGIGRMHARGLNVGENLTVIGHVGPSPQGTPNGGKVVTSGPFEEIGERGLNYFRTGITFGTSGAPAFDIHGRVLALHTDVGCSPDEHAGGTHAIKVGPLMNRSATIRRYGWGDIPLSADYDGDGQSELTIWRTSFAYFYSKEALNGTVTADSLPWGNAPDFPLVGNFDGVEGDDVAIFRPSNDAFWVRTVSGNVLVSGLPTGLDGGLPLVGDYDGDGSDDMALWIAKDTTWHVWKLSGEKIVNGVPYGSASDVPIVGNFDGIPGDELAVYRSATGQWFARSVAGAVIVDGVVHGGVGDEPVVGDYDGDGVDDLAIWRQSDQAWRIRTTAGDVIADAIQYGATGDIPIVGNMDGVGGDELTTWRPGTAEWASRSATTNDVLFENVVYGVPR